MSHNAEGRLQVPQEGQEDVAGQKKEGDDIGAAWLTLLPWSHNDQALFFLKKVFKKEKKIKLKE